MDVLSIREHSLDRNKNNSSSGRSKSRGRSKSPRKSLRKCWKCGKTKHYKKDCRYKGIGRRRYMMMFLPQKGRL
jgi:hypothetical protein